MWKIRSDLLVRRSPFRFRGKFLLQGLCFIPDFRRSFFLNILPNHLVFQVGLLLSRFLILLYNAHNQVRRRIFLPFALILFLGSFWVIFSGFIRYSASISTVYKNFRCNTNDEFCTSILKATENNFNILVPGELCLTWSKGGGRWAWRKVDRKAIISRLILV